MDLNFTFPRLQPAAPRAPPQNPTTTSRESNALRASVLDVALELGLGAHGGIGDWIFSNPLQEEEEDNTSSPATSPSRAHYSAPTSEESSQNSHLIYQTSKSNGTFQNPHIGAFERNNDPSPLPANGNMSGVVGLGIGAMLPGVGPNSVHPDVAPPVPKASTGKNKLRKKRTTGDGYESDGGYVSESSSKRKDRKKEEKEREKERLKEEKRAKAAAKSAAAGADKDSGYATSYETDSNAQSSSAKKSKSKKNTKTTREVGYETDDGYQSSAAGKKKSRFFRLKSKSDSKSDVEAEPELSFVIPPVPAMPPMPLPIAQRFATSSAASVSSLASSNDTESQGPSRLGVYEDSLASTEQNQRRPGVRFLSMAQSEGGTSYEHKHDSSYSTITASITERIASPLPDVQTTPSSRPTISYPITRSTSPLLRSPQDRHVPSPLSLVIPVSNSATIEQQSSGWVNSPGPSSPASPYVIVTPSTDYIVPSPQPSPLPSPNVLRNYDIPPPSPPPTGALPLPPSIPGASSSSVPPSPVWLNRSVRPSGLSKSSSSSSLSNSRQQNFAPKHNTNNSDSDSSLFVKPSREETSSSLSIQPPVKRGVSSPFPSRPINRNPSINVSNGFDAKLRVPRYRELFATPVGGWPDAPHRATRESVPGIAVVEPSEVGSDDRYRETIYDDSEDEDTALRAVLERFDDYTEDDDASVAPSTGVRRSVDLSLPHNPTSNRSSFLVDDRGDDNDDEDLFVVPSPTAAKGRWSGSDYSRASFLDQDRSRQTRGRFIEVVRNMNTNEDQAFGIPPTPRLQQSPSAFQVKGRSRPVPF